MIEVDAGQPPLRFKPWLLLRPVTLVTGLGADNGVNPKAVFTQQKGPVV